MAKKNITLSAAHSTTDQDSTILRLSPAEQLQLATALINPPAPNAALKRAFRRHALLVARVQSPK